MAVHVWSKDGDYLGQIAEARGVLAVSSDNEELRRAMDILVRRPPMNDIGGIEIRFAGPLSRFLEFPSEDWLDVAAVLYLPAAGFRVHVIRNAEREVDL